MSYFRRMLALAALLVVALSVAAQKKFAVYAVGFYNQENLFDTCHDEGKRDYEFLPSGSYKWNGMKYTHKLHNMARVLAEMGTDVLPGVGCAVIGLAEVENAKVLTDLTAQHCYTILHFSPCATLNLCHTCKAWRRIALSIHVAF